MAIGALDRSRDCPAIRGGMIAPRAENVCEPAHTRQEKRDLARTTGINS